MKILLDTHAFIWWNLNPEKLSPQATQLLEDDENETLLSIASIWEMQIKIKIGKLQLDVPLPELIASQQTTNELEILPIKLSHIWTRTYALERNNRLCDCFATARNDRNSFLLRKSCGH